MSVNQIINDGFDILLKVESLINSDSSQARLKSASVALQNFIDVTAQYRPDLIIYAGDREDVIIGGLLGGYLGIPTLHFYGGDHVQDSHIDNPIRHATSKLSTAHCVTLDIHKQRLIKTGENPERIFVTGNIALDRFHAFEPLEKEALLEKFGITEGFDDFALMIFHPIVEEKDNAGEYFDNILQALLKKNIYTFISYPNVDPGNYQIIDVINSYKNNKNFYFYQNLERELFLSIYKRAKFIIGNSSSGITEAASVPIPAINVGHRQTSRAAGKNVIYCKTDLDSIGAALDKATSPAFLDSLKNIKNIYGNGDGARRAFEIINKYDFKKTLYKNEDALEISD